MRLKLLLIASVLLAAGCDVQVGEQGVSLDIARGKATDEWARSYTLTRPDCAGGRTGPHKGPSVNTLARARDVNVNTGNAFAVWDRRVNDDWGVTSGTNPRGDYGLTNVDNRHGFTTAGNWDPWRGLGLGATFVYYTGNPVNELVGDDVNNDLDNFDRPQRGRDDARLPILSKLDANGYAIHNSMPG